VKERVVIMAKTRRDWRRYKDLAVLRDDLGKAARSVWLAGLGLAVTADEEARRVFADFVEEGKDLDERRRDVVARLRDEINRRVETVRTKASEGAQELSAAALHRLGIPTHADIQALLERVERLSKRVHGMGAAA